MYQLTDLRLFEGKAPVSPPDECVKDSLEAEKIIQVCVVMRFGRRARIAFGRTSSLA